MPIALHLIRAIRRIPPATLLFSLLLTVLAAGGAGCAGTQYSFQVVVRNDSPGPITVWLTKDGPPAEVAWLSPEQLSRTQYSDDAWRYAQVIPPRKFGHAGPLRGNFPAGVHPVLRVYDGALQRLSRILAVSPHQPDRLDLVLQHVGRNDYVVHETDGKLTVTAPGQPAIPGGEQPNSSGQFPSPATAPSP